MATYNEQCIDGWAKQQADYIESCDAEALRDCLESMAHHYGETTGLESPVTSSERNLIIAYTDRLMAHAKGRLQGRQ